MKHRASILPLSLVAAFLISPSAAVAAELSDQTISAHRLENVRIVAPASAAKAMVVYFSDRLGWKASDDQIVGALRENGDVVLAVDLSKYAGRLDASDGECLYVVGEITDLAQKAQRKLAMQTYLPPILAGSGEGATFAYAALADAPANTLGGAVSIGFENRLSLRLPFCPGATVTKTVDGRAFAYAFDKKLPEPATLFVDLAEVEKVSELASAQDAITVTAVGPTRSTDAIVEAVANLADSDKPFGELPAIDLPATTPPVAIAILVSGDGGWRDLDKTMGEWLSTKGVHVVGLDALHYFWAKRTPLELAADLVSLVDDADSSHNLPVMLIGYSFGADTLPFAYPLLPKKLQDRIQVLALLAPGQSTSFQITVSGWLGIAHSGYDIPPAIAALPAGRVICVYGKDETDSACLDPSLRAVTKIATDGGHHFDGNYPAIAQRFLDRL